MHSDLLAAVSRSAGVLNGVPPGSRFLKVEMSIYKRWLGVFTLQLYKASSVYIHNSFTWIC